MGYDFKHHAMSLRCIDNSIDSMCVIHRVECDYDVMGEKNTIIMINKVRLCVLVGRM
jgi:hypothetical protein